MGRRSAALLLGVTIVMAACSSQAGSSPLPRPGGGAAGSAVVSRGAPSCTAATQAAPALPASATSMTPAGAFAPFGVAVAADGRWAFISLGAELGVFRLAAAQAPRLVRRIANPGGVMFGDAISPDGRLLVTADNGGAAVISVPAAEQGSQHPVLGDLPVPGGGSGGAVEVAVSRDSRYAFVSLESESAIAVFNLARAVAHGFGPADYVGSIPTQVAPVGLAVSPDGRWLYSTSERQGFSDNVGTVAVINVHKAETDPASSVVDSVTAGCNPVRVITSADGSVVWVTARASDALLAFSASRLRTAPGHALLADVQVGEAPVGLALVGGGTRLVVADSNRFAAGGQAASLAVVDVPVALAGKPALLGYLPAGGFPRDMAAGPGGSTLLVANYSSGQVEAVNIAALP